MGKMYHERTENIAAFRGCNFSCVYCAFGKMLKLSQCDACRTFTPHSHLESFNHKPSKPLQNSFVSIGLSSDISFMPPEDFDKVLDYCRKWSDRTFMIQSKNPEYFRDCILQMPDNVIVGTTLETNRYWPMTESSKHIHTGISYAGISKAPWPFLRYNAMINMEYRKAVTIEPILDFDLKMFTFWITSIKPEFVYIGYVNDKHNGRKFKLPEPPLEKTMQLINELKRAGIEVREKSLRPAWWECVTKRG